MDAKTVHVGLDALRFDNRFVGELPGDPLTVNHRRQVAGACYSRVSPATVSRPQLVAYAGEVAELIDLTAEDCELPQFAEVFSGNRLLADMEPYATCYGGHQFGNWAGQLGDGRAINLGEILNQRGQRWALQIKGAGETPYSRTADGLAVLRSSVREFLCSEAMHHLGVPTTRALSLVLTGNEVLRDMFYDGNPRLEPGAVVCRVAPSFTRFGNFEIFAARGELDVLRQLADYTIRTDFSDIDFPARAGSSRPAAVYLAWFEEVCRRTAEMIVQWMRVGFVHGVMNTDNMSILGLTIDYGPYGWLENFDPNWTPNTTDAGGRRYRYGHQPQIALWNLMQLANALYPLIEQVEALQDALEVYGQTYKNGWQSMMAEKLGLRAFETGSDDELTRELFAALSMVETDMTIFFRKLALLDTEIESSDAKADEILIEPLAGAYYVPAQLSAEYKQRMGAWLRTYIIRTRKDGAGADERRARMNAVNPKYVLRNYLAQLAIDKAELGDFSMIEELLELLRRPYDDQPDKEQSAVKRPDWARNRAGCSMLSCSS